MILSRTLSGLLLLLGLPATALAVPITASFSGVFTEVTDPEEVLPPGVEIGAPFTAFYTIDPDALEEEAYCFPGSYYCSHSLPPGSFRGFLAIGERIFTGFEGWGLMVLTGNNLPEDFWMLSLSLEEFLTLGIWLKFYDWTGRRITDARSFFVNEDLDGWDEAVLTITFKESRAIGTIIPEPGHLALLGLLGVVGLVLIRRRGRPLS